MLNTASGLVEKGRSREIKWKEISVVPELLLANLNLSLEAEGLLLRS